MAKTPTLTDISTSYAARTVLNANNDAIIGAIQNTLSLDGSTPNAMQAALDLNGNDILNAGVVYADSIAVDGVDINSAVATAVAAQAASSANASAAATSASTASSAAATATAAANGMLVPAGQWLTATAYTVGKVVSDSGNSYACLVAHTSGTLSTDIAASRWMTLAEKGASGGGTGDLLASQNLNDLASKPTARTNLGLGSIATQAASAVAITGGTITGVAGIGTVGEVIMHAASTAPSGFLKCNGAAVSRTTYANLFAVIGTTYGTGDGSTTFNLPELRGEFIRGFDDGRGADLQVGRTFGSYQTESSGPHDHYENVPNHKHQLICVDGSGSSYGVKLSTGASQGNLDTYMVLTPTQKNTTTVTDEDGTIPRIETRPRNRALLYCIRF